ncbi:MAG: ComEA family DNA-binding protein [Candidatus Hydrogenedentes bacterium]|nr:ComEA family DNA-binding protein [Candidatus Hydrogenedentota bacterium]
MRITLSDKEWYYGRYILGIIVVLVGIVGGIFMHFRATKEEPYQHSLISEKPTVSLGRTDKATHTPEQPVDIQKTYKEIDNPSIPPTKNSNMEIVGEELPKDSSNSQLDSKIAVSIQGAVKKPGMYWINADARLQNLLDIAGGPLPNAELSYINLAAPLIDGTTVVIPEKVKIVRYGNLLSVKGPTQPVGRIYPSEHSTYSNKSTFTQSTGSENKHQGSESPTKISPTLININTASQKELETLPGIGPVLANSIIEYRKIKPFQSVDELLNVSGIGPKRFEKIRDLVTVSE